MRIKEFFDLIIIFLSVASGTVYYLEPEIQLAEGLFLITFGWVLGIALFYTVTRMMEEGEPNKNAKKK